MIWPMLGVSLILIKTVFINISPYLNNKYFLVNSYDLFKTWLILLYPLSTSNYLSFLASWLIMPLKQKRV